MTVSERIFYIMEQKGMTQKALSQMTGIAQSTMSDWHRKGTNPDCTKIMKIAKALKTTPEDILQDTI